MFKINFGVTDATASLIDEGLYYTQVFNLINEAKSYCYCSLFIVDADPSHDSQQLVYSVLTSLQVADWRGVDVRLLIGGSRVNLDIALASKVSVDIAKELGVKARWLTGRDVRGSHSKFVISDDNLLIGSHNWSNGAFTDQIQDSVLIRSTSLAAYFISIFDGQWARYEIL